MILQRILAIFSAVLLVGSVALATLGPPGLPLGQALLMLHHDLTAMLHVAIEYSLGAWFWDDIAQPLLLRPAWLPLASLGLVCAGWALSAPRGKATGRTRRRSQR